MKYRRRKSSRRKSSRRKSRKSSRRNSSRRKSSRRKTSRRKSSRRKSSRRKSSRRKSSRRKSSKRKSSPTTSLFVYYNSGGVYWTWPRLPSGWKWIGTGGANHKKGDTVYHQESQFEGPMHNKQKAMEIIKNKMRNLGISHSMSTHYS